jgi:hypothetical protein
VANTTCTPIDGGTKVAKKHPDLETSTSPDVQDYDGGWTLAQRARHTPGGHNVRPTSTAIDDHLNATEQMKSLLTTEYRKYKVRD